MLKWSVKKPSSNVIYTSITNPEYLVGESTIDALGFASADINGEAANGPGWVDLNLPPEFFDEFGCWIIRLEAKNPQVCVITDIYEVEIKIEDNINPEFEILNSSNNIVSQENNIYEICALQTVNFDDTTEYEECDGSTFQWFITSVGPDNIPNTGDELNPTAGVDFIYVENNTGVQTSSTSQEPFVQFITPDTYLITQQVTNSCGTFASEKLLLVKGAPFVELPLELSDICKNPSDLPYSINFETNEQYKLHILGTSLSLVHMSGL